MTTTIASFAKSVLTAKNDNVAYELLGSDPSATVATLERSLVGYVSDSDARWTRAAIVYAGALQERQAMPSDRRVMADSILLLAEYGPRVAGAPAGYPTMDALRRSADLFLPTKTRTPKIPVFPVSSNRD